MTDYPGNHQSDETESPRPHANDGQEGWTWQRPDDGSPVFGADTDAGVPRQEADVDPSGPGEPPAVPEPTDSNPPWPAPASDWGGPDEASGPPVFGPAAAPGGPPQPMQADPSWGPVPPPQDAPAPAPQPQYPPPPPAGPEVTAGYQGQEVQGPQGAWQAPYPGTPQVPHYPPGPHPVSPSSGNGRTRVALTLAILALVFALCCLPLGVVLGVTAIVLGGQQRRRAREYGYQDDLAGVAFWLGIVAVGLSLLHLLVNLLILIFYPDLIDRMWRDLGLK